MKGPIGEVAAGVEHRYEIIPALGEEGQEIELDYLVLGSSDVPDAVHVVVVPETVRVGGQGCGRCARNELMVARGNRRSAGNAITGVSLLALALKAPGSVGATGICVAVVRVEETLINVPATATAFFLLVLGATAVAPVAGRAGAGVRTHGVAAGLAVRARGVKALVDVSAGCSVARKATVADTKPPHAGSVSGTLGVGGAGARTGGSGYVLGVEASAGD